MKLTEEVLQALSSAVVTDYQVQLVGQLDRKLYLKVNDALTALGGKWNRRAKAHLFDEDPEARIDEAILSGSVDRGQDFGCFFTPPELAARVVEEAQLFSRATVLEPSAGDGALVKAMFYERQDLFIHCLELLPRNVEKLKKLEEALCRKFNTSISITRIDEVDFLRHPKEACAFDRVVMNPPFSRQQDILHVVGAYSFLKPEGRLVSIMAAGVLFRQDKLATSFRKFIEDHDGTIEKLPSGSFKASGTNVETVLVTIPRGPRE